MNEDERLYIKSKGDNSILDIMNNDMNYMATDFSKNDIFKFKWYHVFMLPIMLFYLLIVLVVCFLYSLKSLVS